MVILFLACISGLNNDPLTNQLVLTGSTSNHTFSVLLMFSWLSLTSTYMINICNINIKYWFVDGIPLLKWKFQFFSFWFSIYSHCNVTVPKKCHKKKSRGNFVKNFCQPVKTCRERPKEHHNSVSSLVTHADGFCMALKRALSESAWKRAKDLHSLAEVLTWGVILQYSVLGDESFLLFKTIR